MSARMRMIPKGLISGWDRWLFWIAVALTLIGLMGIRSAAATLNPALAAKQAAWALLGLVGYLIIANVPYPRLIDLGTAFHVLVLLLLVVVIVAGEERLGATRWLSVFGLTIQPSELAKMTTACWLARVVARHAPDISWRVVLKAVLVMGIPAGLVFIQPDLGSSSIFGAMWLGVMWSAGVSPRILASLAAAGAALAPLAWHLLRDYQRLRLTAFLNPNMDPLGAGYTTIQSRLAIGSGQLWGRGWMAGTQSQLNFLPERHSDFLYSVVGEEWGFLGAALVVMLFGLLIWRIVRIAAANSDPHGRLLAAAVASWIGYQALVNLGMVMGVLPVVGIPLPMMSYGGSAMLMAWIGLGCVQSVHRFGTRF